MGCVAYDVVYVIKSAWMSEHALHFVIRCGVWGLQGASPYIWFWPFFFFFLLVSSVTYGYDDNTPTIITIMGNNFATTNFGRKKCVGVPLPPSSPSPSSPSPLPPPPPPLSAVVRAGTILSETFCQDCGSVVSITYLGPVA